MKQPRTEDQENLAAYTWMLAQHRAALAQQLADVEDYVRQAVRVASQYGVKQTDLATLTGRSAGRISQIIAEAPPVPGDRLRETRERWCEALDAPGAHLERLSKRFSTPESSEMWKANYELVHGKGPDGI
ncbi:hypothetical protein AL755_03425 (plasmid) [Arthrobacter sp. ERGS1:01]|uniref:hypothetical protein n=1 Tax=Arthrobacter sp. ERGS1:01 TaxID=1704044 RepID=UPI0006B68184|nr:hypothetical protein [Arthrobacter sp. ERGS1:01]ALE04752.1 hypothetical protein AL755_03425 [Arthrobacter sp. ERGS1:01]